MKKVTRCALYLAIAALALAPAGAQGAFSAEAGVSPNTMGTFGESISVAYRPLGFLKLGLEGSHDQVYKKDVEVTRIGVSLSEDVYRDILSGSARLELPIAFGPLQAAPFASWSLERGDSEIDATTVDADLPLSIGGFREIAILDLTNTLSLGTSLRLDLGRAGALSVAGSWAPLRFGSSDETRLIAYPRKDSGDWNADFSWLSTTVALKTKGWGWAADAAYDLGLGSLGKLRITGRYQYQTLASSASFENLQYWLGKALATDEWAEESTSYAGVAKIDVVESRVALGASLGLDVVRKALSLRGAPVLSCEYALTLKENTHNYYEELVKDYWRERYDWVQFGLKWGL